MKVGVNIKGWMKSKGEESESKGEYKEMGDGRRYG